MAEALGLISKKSHGKSKLSYIIEFMNFLECKRNNSYYNPPKKSEDDDTI